MIMNLIMIIGIIVVVLIIVILGKYNELIKTKKLILSTHKNNEADSA